MGGKSPEHEISLISGREVIRNLNPAKYEILPIIISKDGKKWQMADRKEFFLDSPTLNQYSDNLVQTKYYPKSQEPNSLIQNNNIDLVFIAMHGPYGEDGTIQGFLDLVGVPYTGSKVLASALGMDKIYSRKLFTQAGLKVPKSLVLTKNDDPKVVWQKFSLPIFIKPARQGSSVGTSKVSKKSNLEKALKIAFSFGSLVLIEEYLAGTEITVGVLGNDKVQALPPVEIVPKNEFFDYEAKYQESKCEEICPARINDSLKRRAQEIAIKAFHSLGCRGFGRIDMIIQGKDIYVLEVNTIPGLTPMSLFPKAAKAAGISYRELLDKIIVLALAN